MLDKLVNKHNVYYIDDVKQNNIPLKYGDIVVVGSCTYIVTSFAVSAIPDSPCMYQYNLELIDNTIAYGEQTDIALDHIIVTQYHDGYQKEEEISEEIRNKFVSLLE
jgi:hypothetical protein